MQRIQLQIFQVRVLIQSEWNEVIGLLEKDFWSFLSHEENIFKHKEIKINLIRQKEKPFFPPVVSSMQTQNAISYDLNGTRYCDYYGKLYSVVNFNTDEAVLYSDDLEKMHEIAYLLILSRAGKYLDRRGLHKLHAFAVSLDDQVLMCMMPSKGGKSTLLTELLRYPRIKMISDDIPFIDSSGNVLPFLLKIGLDNIPEEMVVENPEENIYTMKRSLYGTKTLICTRGIPDRLEKRTKPFNNIILLEAFRYNAEDSVIIEVNSFKIFKGLFKHGVIGIGSPIILEYFWQKGARDFLLKTIIFLKRFKAFLLLAKNSRKYHLYMSNNPRKTARYLYSLLEGENPFV